MTNELKPCPFCGNLTPHFDEYSNAVSCDMCDFRGPPGANAEQAIEAWNTRVPPKENTSPAELKFFAVCPLCGGFVSKHCPRCDGNGFVRWTPKAAPLVWEDDELSSSARIPFVSYHLWGCDRHGWTVAINMVGLLDPNDLTRPLVFAKREDAKARCQAHADALVKQLIEGKRA